MRVPLSGLHTFSSTATKATLIATGLYDTDVEISPDGTRMYVNDVDAATITVYDTKTNTVIGSFATPFETLGPLAVGKDGSVLLAVDTVANAVVAFDTSTGDYTQLAAVPTTTTTDGYYPGAALSPDGTQFYYVADNGAVQVISLIPPDAKRTIGAPVLNTSDPTTGAITGTVAAIPAGTKLTYTLISRPANGTLVFNKTTGAFTYTATAAQRILAGLSAETDTVDFTVTVTVAKTTVPVTITVPVSPTQIADVGDVATGAGAWGVAVTNTRAYVANADAATVTVIDIVQRTKITDIAVDDFPLGIAVSPDGSKVYVSAQGTNTVSVIDATTNTVSSQIQLGDRSPQLMAISKNGKTLYVTTTVYDPVDDHFVISSGITKISTATNKITGTVKTSAWCLTRSPSAPTARRSTSPRS
jgi:YVTN family beta-propeller protein